MRMMCIASGSKGNCTYIGSEHTHILIDDGISLKRVTEGLKELSLSPADLQGIFITHEHSDHISGLKVLSKKYQIPIYASVGTIAKILSSSTMEGIDPALFNVIKKDSDIPLGDLVVHSMKLYHDASEPLAYTVSDGNKKVGLITDLGHYDDYIIDNLQGLHSVVLEANHDVRMLEAGSYPYSLKRRILSDVGHLSNENSGRLLDKILNPEMEHIFLGHLSEENNTSDLAYAAVSLEIDQSESEYKAKDFHMEVARQDIPMPYVTI